MRVKNNIEKPLINILILSINIQHLTFFITKVESE